MSSPMSSPNASTFVSMVGGGHKTSAFSPAVVAIIVILGSAFLVVSYYRIFARLFHRWQYRAEESNNDGQLNHDAQALPLVAHGLAEPLIHKIPVFHFKTGDGFTADTDCRVCLSEFTDEEELRLLPKCAHAFHIRCIDTWLATHCTCPLCRANIWPEQVMNQYPVADPENVFDSGEYAPPGRYRMENPFTIDLAAFTGRGSGRSSTPTLRGLLNSEDLQYHTTWMSGPSGRGGHAAEDPGEVSIRLYHPRDHGGDSSARHHSVAVFNAPSTPSRISSSRLSTDAAPQDSLSRNASLKWDRSLLRTASLKGGGHASGRRPSFRRNPFSVVRSYSMGTSRRLVNALEFLDLEDLPNSQSKGGEKVYSPLEYEITESRNYSSNLTVSEASAVGGGGGAGNDVAGPSSALKESFRGSQFLDSSSDPDSHGAALKITSAARGRSVSFRSPFSLKRSLSGGRSRFSFRYANKGRVFTSSDSPILLDP